VVSYSPTQLVLNNLQRKDEFVSKIIEYQENKSLPNDEAHAAKIMKFSSDMLLYKGFLYRKITNKKNQSLNQLVVPSALIPDIISGVHDGLFGGHLGFAKTFSRLHKKYWWPSMIKDVKSWIKTCPDCQAYKARRVKYGFLQPIPVGNKFVKWAVDIIGPLPLTQLGNKYILVFTEYLTRWPEAFAIKDASAEVVAKMLLEEILSRFGAPMELLSDRGAVFTSNW